MYRGIINMSDQTWLDWPWLKPGLWSNIYELTNWIFEVFGSGSRSRWAYVSLLRRSFLVCFLDFLVEFVFRIIYNLKQTFIIAIIFAHEINFLKSQNFTVDCLVNDNNETSAEKREIRERCSSTPKQCCYRRDRMRNVGVLDLSFP